MIYNYAIIIFGDMKIEGKLVDWEDPMHSSTMKININGKWYRTNANNVLLMQKDEEELGAVL